MTPATVSEVLATLLLDLSGTFRDRVFADVVMAGYDLIGMSERFFTNDLGGTSLEASMLVDALFPHRLEMLGQVRPAMRASRR